MTAEKEQKSLDTIKAVLEMTEVAGCPPAEASVARDKARRLMRKYLASLDHSSPEAPQAPSTQAPRPEAQRPPAPQPPKTSAPNASAPQPPKPEPPKTSDPRPQPRQRRRVTGVWADIKAAADSHPHRHSRPPDWRDALGWNFEKYWYNYVLVSLPAALFLFSYVTHLSA
jgi:hypothetical protein